MAGISTLPGSALPGHVPDAPLDRGARPVSAEKWALLLVIVTAVLTGAILYSRYLASARELWSNVIHDRNAHLESGLALANDLRHGRLLDVVSDLDKLRTWPVFHDGFLVGTVLLLGNGDERYAILPSLLGWIGAVIFAFLATARALPRFGWVGGLLAALLVLVSPAFKAYATDVMLESVGACLTLMSLYFYLCTVQDGSAVASRWLALSLTALCLHKYNYWILAVACMIADRFAADPIFYLHWLGQVLGSGAVWKWMHNQLRRPMTYVIGALLGLSLLGALAGHDGIRVLSVTFSPRSTAVILTLAYWLFIIQLAPWYWRVGRWNVRDWPVALQAMVNWHLLPVAAWFLWPRRLSSFLWVANPETNAGEFPQRDLWGGYAYYWNSFVHDYQIGLWSALVVVALALWAAWSGFRKQLRPGAGAVFWLVAISIVLSAHHPNRKSRFLHSWLGAAWVAAGVGAVSLVGSRAGRTQYARSGLAGLVGAMALMHLPGLSATPHAPEGGIEAGRPSTLEVTDSYLTALEHSRKAAVFSNLPMKALAHWTYTRRFGRPGRVETDIKGFDPAAPDNHDAFQKWLATTSCDTLVYVDIPGGTAFHVVVPGATGMNQYGKLLEEQTLFVPTSRVESREHGWITTVWKRKEISQAAR